MSQEGCDSFGGFERGLEGCLPWEKAPPRDFFGDMPEDEEIVPWPSFPESPGAEDKEFAGSSGAGPFPQTPPYLECPSAVFLEELETGAIECHASDALGEEHLEYEWEPVGNTTRDYLDNPRLLPEDVPDPSVVAPEAPVYETLESFRSGETTFRYRYRLTATSRATGLSSHSEVEVYVSSSRPSVYCPLEVAVEEGETAQLDCEGVDPLSHRMDYDEDGASILWEWEGLWGTSTSLLDATDMPSPLFTAPAGSAGSQYHYIASMTSSASGVARTARRKVTVTVTGGTEGGTQAAADASALADKRVAPVITCNDAEIYEATEDFTLDCSVTDEPSGATYAWTGTDIANRLSSATILKPTFIVPDNIREPYRMNKDYAYTVTLSASGITDVTENVKVTVLEKPDIECAAFSPLRLQVNEGSQDFVWEYCTRSWHFIYGTSFDYGAAVDSRLRFEWTPRGSTLNTNLLSATDIQYPTFFVPDDVSGDTTFEYLFTVSAEENVDPLIVYATVTVRDTDPPVLSITCIGTEVYEAAADITLDCSVTNEPSGATYAWAARGSTSDTDDLSSTTILKPTFSVPDDIDELNGVDKAYDYTVTLSAGGADVASADITVTVLEKPDIYCPLPTIGFELDEGQGDFPLLICRDGWKGAPVGSDYAYAWTARGSTANTDLLISGTDGSTPTFAGPDEVESVERYYYTLTVSAANADDASVEVDVVVFDRPDITVTCEDSPYDVNESDADIELECDASGGPTGSTYTWSWFPTANLTDHDTATPTFAVPDDVDQDRTYTYTVTATADRANDGTAEVTVTVRDLVPVITCSDSEIYEATVDFSLDCSVTNEPSGATYVWTGTDIANRLSGTTILKPTFLVPRDIPGRSDTYKEIYEYRLTISVEGVHAAAADITVVVLEKPDIRCIRNTTPSYVSFVVGEGYRDITIGACPDGWEGAPGNSYTYLWTTRGDTPDTALLSAPDISRPLFLTPDIGDLHQDTVYKYRLTVSADNADPAVLDVDVYVSNKTDRIDVTCAAPDSVYEGSEDIVFDCVASGAPGGRLATGEPAGSAYSYVWTARGDTPDVSLLSATDISSPVFYVSDEVDATTTYEYLLTVSAQNAEDAAAEVTVTVLNKGRRLRSRARIPVRSTRVRRISRWTVRHRGLRETIRFIRTRGRRGEVRRTWPC